MTCDAIARWEQEADRLHIAQLREIAGSISAELGLWPEAEQHFLLARNAFAADFSAARSIEAKAASRRVSRDVEDGLSFCLFQNGKIAAGLASAEAVRCNTTGIGSTLRVAASHRAAALSMSAKIARLYEKLSALAVHEIQARSALLQTCMSFGVI